MVLENPWSDNVVIGSIKGFVDPLESDELITFKLESII